MNNDLTGYEEIEHTADWAIRVWAPDLDRLLEMAAKGMNELSELVCERKRHIIRAVRLSALDAESLLVDFLNEILYYGEVEHIGFEHYEIQLEGLILEATLYGSGIISQKKEIKAVTFHDLAVKKTNTGLEAVIVFDV